MKEAATTWALVAGIDVYDEPAVPRLTGAVADAVAAVRWLRRLGVPDEQILLHASPSDASKPDLVALGLPWKEATEPDLWKSVARLRKVTGGTRLFVFLSGHGLYEPSTRRLFLTQEAGPDAWTNLGMDAYIELFRSMAFPRQFLFLDGCQNYPYAETARPVIEAAMHAGVTGYTARPGNLLVACFAAGQGQRALEVDGRGLFLRHLLEGLDLDTPFEGAIDLDFETGARTVDLRKLVQQSILPRVEREARAQTPPLDQTPDFKDFGPTSVSYPVVRLRDVDTATLEVRVLPPDAESLVRKVRVIVDEPLWLRQMPRIDGDPIPLPLVNRLPLWTRGTVSCDVRQGAWRLERSRHEFEVDRDLTLTFQLREEPGKAPGSLSFPAEAEPVRGPFRGFPVESTEGEEVLRVRTRSTSGALIANTFDYDEVAQTLGLPEETRGWRVEVADGVVMEHHEIGPDFIVRSGRRAAGQRLARGWAEAIQRATPPDVVVSIESPAGSPEAPVLRIELPPGGARSLGGFLTGRPVVWIGPPGDEPTEPFWRRLPSAPGRQMTLDELERQPELKVEPGPVRVRLDLPWGSWTSLVRVPDSGEAMVALPATVGTPPLRVALDREAGRSETLVLGTEGPAPGIRLRPGLTAEAGEGLTAASPGFAAWALQPPRAVVAGRDLADVDLGGGRRALFPLLPERPLALDLSRGGVRVEALSTEPTPAWDLLMAAGRLDVLLPHEAEDLARGKWKDWLLGLAGAYVVYAQPAEHRPDYLKVVLKNLTHLAAEGSARSEKVPDLDLLRLALRSPGEERLSRKDVQPLTRWAKAGAVPVLRWGVALAVRLLHEVEDERLAAWRDDLARIEPRLSPISVWTAWTESADD